MNTVRLRGSARCMAPSGEKNSAAEVPKKQRPDDRNSVTGPDLQIQNGGQILNFHHLAAFEPTFELTES